jgi:hypothetical protein
MPKDQAIPKEGTGPTLKRVQMRGVGTVWNPGEPEPRLPDLTPFEDEEDTSNG